MIVFIVVPLFFVFLFSVLFWFETKGEYRGFGVTSLVSLIFLILSIYLFASSKYPQPNETIYPINIAPNHIAYITRKDEIINISCIVKQNVSEADKYVTIEYPGYWAGYIYVDGKVEHKILRHAEDLIP